MVDLPPAWYACKGQPQDRSLFIVSGAARGAAAADLDQFITAGSARGTAGNARVARVLVAHITLGALEGVVFVRLGPSVQFVQSVHFYPLGLVLYNMLLF